MKNTYKFRVYPTEEQTNLIRQSGGSVRFLKNKFIELEIEEYETKKSYLNEYELNNLIPGLKEKYPFLKEIPSQALQQASKDVSMAYKKFFNKKGGYPKFKKKNRDRDSFRLPQGYKLDFSKELIYLPKIGWIKIVIHRRVVGTVKNVTITLEKDGAIYASLCCEDSQASPLLKGEGKKVEELNIVGIDLGVSTLAFTTEKSYGKYEIPKKLEKKYKREQKRLSRKEKGSNNKEKQRKIVAKVSAKIANQRHDHLHKTTNSICNSQTDVIVVEDLNAKGMVKNHNLAKAISNASFGTFVNIINYKAERRGIRVIIADRFYPSSQMCSVCKTVNKKVKDLSIREWKCEKCSTIHNRDFNAAINLRNYGKRALAQELGEVMPVEIATVD